MLKVLAQIARELDIRGLHADADDLLETMEKIATTHTAKKMTDADYEEMAREVMDKMPDRFKNFGSLVSKLKNMGFESTMSACEYFEDEKTASSKKKIVESGKYDNKPLNKPFRTPDGPKKFSVYVKNDKGNIVKVNFGDPDRKIKRSNPERRKNFRARHNCDSDPRAKDKTTAKYWSCANWEAGKSVSDNLKGK
jgi:hypothetical protein